MRTNALPQPGWPTWLSRAAMGLAVTSALLVLASGLGHRLGLFDFRVALDLYGWGIVVAMPAVMVAIIAVVAGLFKKARFAVLIRSVVAVAIAFVVLSAGTSFKSKARSVPMIHDITTDTENPPQFVEIPKQREGATNSLDYAGAEIAEQQRAAYPDVEPVVLDEGMGQAFARALEVANDSGWDIVSAKPEDGRIEAVDTTFFFGFKDDVVVRLTEVEPGRTRVDMRSVSRVGRSDVGANAARIRRYLAELKP